MDLAVASPASAAGAVSPASPHRGHLIKGGGVELLGAARALCRCKAYFFPFSRLFTVSLTTTHRADHAPVRLGNHLLGSGCRQNPERLLVLLVQNFRRPLGVMQGRIAHGAGVDFKPIMLQH